MELVYEGNILIKVIVWLRLTDNAKINSKRLSFFLLIRFVRNKRQVNKFSGHQLSTFLDKRGVYKKHVLLFHVLLIV